MSASYTSGQSSCPRIQPAALRRKRATLSLAHRSWSLNWDTHLYPPHNNSSVHLIPQQQEYGALGGSPMECRVVGENCETPYFHSWHRHPPYWNDPAKSSMILVKPPPHRCWTFPLLLVQMGYGLFCECGAEEKTVDHVVLQRPTHRPPHGLHGLTVLDSGVIVV